MTVRELRELFFQDALRRFHVRSLFFGPELQQQAFAEVPGAHAGRLKFLDYRQNVLNLVLSHLHSRAEGHIVHQGFDVATEVAVGVETADDELPYLLLALAEVTITELLPEALGEAFLYGEGVVFRTGVLAPVVHFETVGRDVAVAVFHGVDGDIAGVLFVFVLGRIRIGVVIQHGIVFKLSTYLLLQFLNRKLDELYGLNLKRGKTLRLLEFQPLFLHVSVLV